MPYKAREFTCGCGATFTRRLPAGATPSCANCAVQRSIDNATQLHNGSGPYFDRWAAAMAKAIPRIAGGVAAAERRTGISPADAGRPSPTSPSPG